MKEFSYPNNNKLLVTDQTVEKTGYTFDTKEGIWEPKSIKYFYDLVEIKHKNKNAVIVDVGAQSGLYTLYAKFLPDCQFLAYEPLEETYALLLDNLTLNTIYNVKAYNYALGSKEEVKNLHVPHDHLGLNTLGDTPKRFDSWKDISVQVKRLDDVLAEDQPVDYMKIDTEGWEYHVLKGAERTIRKWKPELFLEVNGENMKQCSVQENELLDFLTSMGYKKVRVIDNENVHFTYDA